LPAVRKHWARLVQAILVIVAAVAAFAAVVPTSASASLSTSPIAFTDKGFIRGTSSDDVHAFRGIPYAAPPVGDLRWRPPQPAAAWSGVRDATQFGAHCAQNAGPFGQASQSEDCLFLNVFAPRLAIPGVPVAPVMVWIHGGALVVGESDDYDPTALVNRGVIVVTINYRLGALGFLAHPALAAESPQGAAGNYGLMDQQAALSWVQRNIRNFGGNPRNVTIFGESAGGLSVHSQLVSPTAKGLFDKAIVESGAYQLNQPSLATAEASGTTFANNTGCASQTAACLRSLPVATILARQGGASPTVDGLVLTATIRNSILSGNFNQVPVMEGSNHDEWRLFVAQAELVAGPLSAAGYIAAIQRTLGVSAAAANALAATYPLSAFPSPSLALSALGTDAIFACNARKVVDGLSQNVPVFQYEFNDPDAPQRFLPPVSFPTGAYHASEIQYLFNLPETVAAPALDADQRQLSRTMVRYWTNFAWFSNPNGLGTPFFPRFDSTNLRDQELVPGNSPKATTVVATNFADDHHCALFGTTL
jgi:para-nitrobenzyl esterase